MTTINSQEDFLRALRENPEWREAVRAQILGDELIQLPAAFQVLTDTLTQFIVRQEGFNQRQEDFNRNTTTHFERMETDMSGLKGEYARSRTVEDARGIASDMGLEYVRTLTRDDLADMARGAGLPTDTLRSFRNADLVIETTDGTETGYVAMEISFTADKREYDRTTRNALLINRFTGKQAQAAIASVRNDAYVTQLIQSGAIHWHPQGAPAH